MILILFFLWKAFTFSAARIASHVLPQTSIGLADKFSIAQPYLLWIWANFDGVNYVEIARGGYHYPNFAYFPLYPLVIAIGREALKVSYVQSGLIVSSICVILALFFLSRIVALDFSKNIALASLIVALALPTAFFYGAVYADSLYLLLSTASFYFARKSAWFWASVFGFIAGLTRLVGIVLLPALIVEWYLQKRSKIKDQRLKILATKFMKERVFFIFLIPLGIVAYGLYLQLNFGDFFLFQKSMTVWNQEKFVFPLQVGFRYLKIIFTAEHNFIYFVAIVELISTVLYFALSIYVLLKVRVSYGVFMLLTLLIPTFTGTFQSMPRYILHLFPAFIALAILTSRSKKAFWSIIAIFLLIQGLFVAFFTRGYFVA